MKMLMIVPMIAVALSTGFMGCEPRNDDIAKVEPKAGDSNLDLAKNIKVILDTDDQLRAANLSVNADSNKKEATLSGTVESETLRSRAVDLAKGVQPDLKVNDMIEVKSRDAAREDFTGGIARQEPDKAKQVVENVGRTIEDTWLQGKILTKLVGNAKTPARNIGVEVVDGVVTLRGTVESSDVKAEAQRLAQATEGVKRVDNRLEVNT